MGKPKTETISEGLQVEGLKETLRAFRTLDKEASVEARDKAQEIANKMAGYIRAAAPGDIRNQNLASSVRAGRDRVPVVRVGGLATPRVSGGGGPRELVIGMEFGAYPRGPNGWRFPPRTPKLGKGNAGYWIYPTARARQTEIARLWQESMKQIIDKWSD
jgi:hypothetical protein